MVGSIAERMKMLGQHWEEQDNCFAIVLVEKGGVKVAGASLGTLGAL